MNLKKWIEALRSGSYPQTMGTLKNSEGYCCLGVYAEIKGILPPNEKGYGQVYPKLREDIPTRIIDEGIEMNDAGYTFAEIANMIEKELAPQ